MLRLMWHVLFRSCNMLHCYDLCSLCYQSFYCQFVLTINISGRRMWTTRFTYFDSKCMHLSKLLHNRWSTLFVLIYFLSGRTDNRKTVYIYIRNSIISSNWQKLYQFLACGPLDLNTLTWLYALVSQSI